MNKFIALTLVTLGITVSAREQWVVFDPTAQIQSIINTAQEIAQFVTMVENQGQQIQPLGDQLSEFKITSGCFAIPLRLYSQRSNPRLPIANVRARFPCRRPCR